MAANMTPVASYSRSKTLPTALTRKIKVLTTARKALYDLAPPFQLRFLPYFPLFVHFRHSELFNFLPYIGPGPSFVAVTSPTWAVFQRHLQAILQVFVQRASSQ